MDEAKVVANHAYETQIEQLTHALRFLNAGDFTEFKNEIVRLRKDLSENKSETFAQKFLYNQLFILLSQS
jgi:hypothetical protein